MIIFFWIWSIVKVYIICCNLQKSHIWEKSDSWDMGQNALGQSYYRIFKSNCISWAKLWKSLIFCMFIQIHQNYKLIENYWNGLVKNGCGYSVLRTLKLVVCQGEMNGINWFLVCWYKFRKAKSYFINFLVVVVKNGPGLLGPGTLKFAALQEPID